MHTLFGMSETPLALPTGSWLADHSDLRVETGRSRDARVLSARFWRSLEPRSIRSAADVCAGTGLIESGVR